MIERVELVRHGEFIYVVAGSVADGYSLLLVDGAPLATFRHKYEARRAALEGTFETGTAS